MIKIEQMLRAPRECIASLKTHKPSKNGKGARKGARYLWADFKAGNRIAAIDGKTASTIYVFDARGRQKSQKDRNNGTTAFAYLTTGQLQSLTDAESQTTSYTYDDAGGKLTE